MNVDALRVAVVDDSTFIRMALTRMLADAPEIEVVGAAGSGEELLTHLETWQPDVVTLDLDMPGMGGLATLDRLMATRPTPVIILSTHSGEGAPQTIEALHRGATDFVDKQQYSLVDFSSLRQVLLEKIFLVTGREPPTSNSEPKRSKPAPPPPPQVRPARGPVLASTAYDLIAIGASTGGPPTIQRILEDFGPRVPVPIVVVQHMPIGFTQAFAERLNAYLPLQVREVYSSEILQEDTVYMAPAGLHLRIQRRDEGLVAELNPNPRDVPHVPSVDVLFESVADSVGSRAIALLLTGMGRDGAAGMTRIKARGGYTFAQNEETCVVFGMPRAAIAQGGAVSVSPPSAMASRVLHLVEHGTSGLPT